MSFLAKKGGDDTTQPDRKLGNATRLKVRWIFYGHKQELMGSCHKRLAAITQDSFHAWLHDSGNLRNT